VAFKSLLSRNKAAYMSELAHGGVQKDGEEVKLNLPFIVINTSKETVIDCWLAADRSYLLLDEISQSENLGYFVGQLQLSVMTSVYLFSPHRSLFNSNFCQTLDTDRQQSVKNVNIRHRSATVWEEGGRWVKGHG